MNWWRWKSSSVRSKRAPSPLLYRHVKRHISLLSLFFLAKKAKGPQSGETRSFRRNYIQRNKINAAVLEETITKEIHIIIVVIYIGIFWINISQFSPPFFFFWFCATHINACSILAIISGESSKYNVIISSTKLEFSVSACSCSKWMNWLLRISYIKKHLNVYHEDNYKWLTNKRQLQMTFILWSVNLSLVSKLKLLARDIFY